MARGFREIPQRAEELLEKGKKADQLIQTRQSLVTSAQSELALARRELAIASQTDEQGNHSGDVDTARAKVMIAEQYLTVCEHQLEEASEEVERINVEKRDHIRKIESHNEAEKTNLDKLRKLQAHSFASDSSALSKGIVERMNAAEKARVKLLRSMGIEVSPHYYSEPEQISTIFHTTAHDLDSIGEDSSNPDNQSNGFNSDQQSDKSILNSHVTVADSTSQNAAESSDNLFIGEGINQQLSDTDEQSLVAQKIDYYLNCLFSPNSSPQEKIMAYKCLKNFLLCLQKSEDSGNSEKAKTLHLSPKETEDNGMRYIDNILEVYRDCLRDQGLNDGKAMEEWIASYRKELETQLRADITNGTWTVADHDVPDFRKIASELKQQDIIYVQSQIINDLGASVVDLSGFDSRVAHDMANALIDAKNDFPELNISYFGSCQAQLDAMRADLTLFYSKELEQYRQPGWSDQQFEMFVEANVEKFFSDYKFYVEPGDFAWSLSTNGIDPSNTMLAKYNGVAINLDYASDYEEFQSSKYDDVTTKYKPEGCDNSRATMDHELGHEIDRMLEASSDRVIQKLYWKMKRKDNAEEVLSGYADTSIAEFIAEGYSEYRNNPHPREYAETIYNRLVYLRSKKTSSKSSDGSVFRDSSTLFWGTWQDYEKVTKNGQQYALIGNRCYSKHAVERMQPSGNRYRQKQKGHPEIVRPTDFLELLEWDGKDNEEHTGRGVAPHYVEMAIHGSQPVSQGDGTFIYTNGSLSIIVNSDGDVVTIEN